MAGTHKIIYVYDDFSYDQPLLMGTLYVAVIKGGESYSFEYDNDLAIQTALRFGIHVSDAEKYAKEILGVVRNNWNRLASEYGLSRRQIEEMKPAFSACYE